jgi:uncharacterized protein YjdB
MANKHLRKKTRGKIQICAVLLAVMFILSCLAANITFADGSTQAPALNVAPTAAADTTNGATKVTASPNTTGDVLAVEVSTTSITTPKVGDPVPTGINVTNPYTSGSDISGVVYGDYAGVYELVYGNGTVVAFSQIQLTTAGATVDDQLPVMAAAVTLDTNTVAAPQDDTDVVLSDLRVDGTTITGFVPTTLTYSVVLPAGLTAVPTVAATVYDTGKATDVVTQASDLNGQATVVVIARDGASTQTYTIAFTEAVLASGITVTSAGSSTSVVNGATLQMSATVLPADAANQTVTWSVTPGGIGNATIDASTGLLTATAVGAVTVTATANDASRVTGSKTIAVNPILVRSITI